MTDFANVASATQELALLLLNPSTATSSTSIPPEAVDSDVFSRKYPLRLGQEGVLPSERREEAKAVFDSLGPSAETSASREVRLAL